MKVLTMNDNEYYNSDKNDAEGDPKIDPKVATHTSDEKKKGYRHRQRKSAIKKLSNRILPIITTTIDPRIPDGVATCGGNTHACTTPTSMVVITDVACSSAHVLRTPGDVSRKVRDGTTPHDCNASIRSPMLKYPVLIGGTDETQPVISWGARILSVYMGPLVLRKSGITKSSTPPLMKI